MAKTHDGRPIPEEYQTAVTVLLLELGRLQKAAEEQERIVAKAKETLDGATLDYENKKKGLEHHHLKAIKIKAAIDRLVDTPAGGAP